jgi:hypothetical protein
MWSALILSGLTLVILYILYKDRLVWWEPLICFVPTIILIAIVSYSTELLQTRDTEWLTDVTHKVEYYEKWTEEWDEVVTETDSDGNVSTRIETHTDHHPEHWEKVTKGGNSFGITESEYNRIKSDWGNKDIYVDLYHIDQRKYAWDGRGDMFYCDWPGTRKTIKPVAWTRSYENRIQASDNSILKFPEVSEERKKKLFEYVYPDSNCNTPAILGDGGSTQVQANKELMIWNSIVGPRSENSYSKACRMWILIFKSKDIQDAMDQEAYWQGGNKNEIILCLGVDEEYKLNWSYVISWSKNEQLKIDIRNYPELNEVIDLNDIVGYMGKECKERFERRQFREFSYLNVSPPTWAIILVWVITLLLNAGVGFYVVNNEFDNDGYKPRWSLR